MFVLLFSTVPTRCCAAALRETTCIPHHHTVRAAFLSMHADCNGDCFRRCLEQLTIYKYCPLFLSVVRYAVFQIANLGDYTRSFFGDIPPKKRCPGTKPLFLHQKKVPGIPGAKNDLA